MPRYFLDVCHQGDRTTRDFRGLDVPDLGAAEVEALELWKRIVARELEGDGTDIATWKVQIRDEAGALLAEVPFDLCPWRAHGTPDQLRKDALLDVGDLSRQKSLS